MNDENRKIGLGGLTAIVFGAIMGGGIFNIPKIISADAGLGAILITWVITTIGVLTIVLTFNRLVVIRPDLYQGIYQYAKEGFGNYIGFNIAWGYWLCVAFGNVVFAIMLNDSFGEFFPILLKHSWPTVLLGSFFIWMMYAIVSFGVKSATILNAAVTVIKFATLLFVVVALIVCIKPGQMHFDFWGKMGHLGSVGSQVKNTMLITLWCFIGIEGAIVMSARAKRIKDVGKAGIIGFFCSLLIWMIVTIFAFGILPQHELSHLKDPSVAYILKIAIGDWAYTFIIISIILAVIGGWIAWTLICAQVPFTAAQLNIFPRFFQRVSKRDVPIYSLLFSTIAMQIFFLLVLLAKSVFYAAVVVEGVLIVPAYAFCAFYLIKLSFAKQELNSYPQKQLWLYRIISIVAACYCLWLLYAGGLVLFFITSVFYFIGIGFFIKARRQVSGNGLRTFSLSFKKSGGKVLTIFTKRESYLALILGVSSVISIVLIILGKTIF